MQRYVSEYLVSVKKEIVRSNGAMEQWSNGAVEQRSNGAMEQWSNGAMEQWSHRATDLEIRILILNIIFIIHSCPFPASSSASMLLIRIVARHLHRWTRQAFLLDGHVSVSLVEILNFLVVVHITRHRLHQ